MTRREGKRRLTLSEHLALRKAAAEESKAREEARLHSMKAIKTLDAEPLCTCPACTRIRARKGGL